MKSIITKISLMALLITLCPAAQAMARRHAAFNPNLAAKVTRLYTSGSTRVQVAKVAATVASYSACAVFATKYLPTWNKASVMGKTALVALSPFWGPWHLAKAGYNSVRNYFCAPAATPDLISNELLLSTITSIQRQPTLTADENIHLRRLLNRARERGLQIPGPAILPHTPVAEQAAAPAQPAAPAVPATAAQAGTGTPVTPQRLKAMGAVASPIAQLSASASPKKPSARKQPATPTTPATPAAAGAGAGAGAGAQTPTKALVPKKLRDTLKGRDKIFEKKQQGKHIGWTILRADNTQERYTLDGKLIVENTQLTELAAKLAQRRAKIEAEEKQ